MTSSLIPRRIAKAVSALAVLAIPTLTVAPIEAAARAPRLGAAPSPQADTGHARVIVKYKADGGLMRESALAARDPNTVAVQHAARLSQRLGLALRDGHTIAPRTQVLRASNLSSAALVARLQADPDVEYAEVDERVRIAAAPNDPLYRGNQPVNVTPTVGQWYLRPPTAQVSAINAEQAWDRTAGSPAIVVAVLDTGVRPDHPDLVGKLVPGYDFVSADDDGSFTSANDGNGRDTDASDPGDFVTQADLDGALRGQGCVIEDSSWHGTQTAALIGASTQNAVGMASVGRNVRVMPVRVLGKCGGFQSDVIAGMYWAAGIAIPATTREGVELGTAPANPFPAKVLNLSLGSSTATCGVSYQDAVNAVVAAGASVVISAGNAGQAVGRPANCNGAIAVGGLRHNGTKVGYSDLGPSIAISAPAGNCVNLSDTDPCLFPILSAINSGTAGPGLNTYSDSFNITVGTSFSAPLVAGTAALMLSVNSALSPTQMRSTLMTSARPFPTTGGTPGMNVTTCSLPSAPEECYCTTSTCGAGMLDVRAAVLAVPAPTTTQPLLFATPAAPPPGTAVTLDGSNSIAADGLTIDSYRWTLVDSGGIATLNAPTNQATATVVTSAAGTFTVRLSVTDSGGATVSKLLAVTAAVPAAPPASDDGGGTLSWPWLLALGMAVTALRPRRR